MGAALDDGPGTEDEDLVAAADGGEAVGDDDGGAVFHELIQGILDEAFALGIEAAGGFIQDQDGGIGEDGAGDGDALALAAGKLGAALADEGVIPFGHGLDEEMGVGLFGGFVDFGLGGVGFAVGDVFADAAAKEEDFLGDEGEVLAEGGQGHVLDGLAIHENSAAGGLIKAVEQGDGGGLATATGADDGDALAGQCFEGKLAQDGGVGTGGVGEAEIVHLDLALEADFGRVGDFGLGRLQEDFADAVGGAEGALELGDELGKGGEGGTDHAAEGGKAGEVSGGNFPLAEHGEGDPGHDDECEAEGKDDEGDKGGPGGCGADGGLEEVAQMAVIAGDLVSFIGKGFDADDALQALFHDDLGAGQVVLGLAGEFADAGTEDGDHDDDHGDGTDHDEGEFDGNLQDEDQATDQHDGMPNEHGDGEHEGFTHGLNIIGKAGGKLTNAPGIEDGHGEPDDAAEGLHAQGG
jgi:hypothetical protein